MVRSGPSASVPLVFLALLASTPFARGQTESVSGGIDEGIWDIPGPIFRDLVSQPNATGSITANPGNGIEYTLQLNITADVPLANATDSIVEDEKSDYATTSILSLVMDNETSSSNTTICYSVWSGLATNISAAAKGTSSQDEAGCADMLSDQCLSDLMSAGGQYTLGCQPAPVLPQSCVSQMDSSYSGLSSAFEYNSSDPVFYMQAEAPTRDRTNQTAWAAVSTNIVPVLLAFLLDGSDEYTVELNCLRPDTFSEGTFNPNVDSTSGTATGGTSTGSPTSQPTSSPSSGAAATDRVSVSMPLGILLAMTLGFF